MGCLRARQRPRHRGVTRAAHRGERERGVVPAADVVRGRGDARWNPPPLHLHHPHNPATSLQVIRAGARRRAPRGLRPACLRRLFADARPRDRRRRVRAFVSGRRRAANGGQKRRDAHGPPGSSQGNTASLPTQTNHITHARKTATSPHASRARSYSTRTATPL